MLVLSHSISVQYCERVCRALLTPPANRIRQIAGPTENRRLSRHGGRLHARGSGGEGTRFSKRPPPAIGPPVLVVAGGQRALRRRRRQRERVLPPQFGLSSRRRPARLFVVVAFVVDGRGGAFAGGKGRAPRQGPGRFGPRGGAAAGGGWMVSGRGGTDQNDRQTLTKIKDFIEYIS